MLWFYQPGFEIRLCFVSRRYQLSLVTFTLKTRFLLDFLLKIDAIVPRFYLVYLGVWLR